MKRSYLFAFLVSFLVVLLAIIFKSTLIGHERWGLFSIFWVNALASATLFFPAPGIATVIAGGALYHPLAVAFAAAIGATVGDLIGFFIGHAGKHMLLRKKQHIIYEIVKQKFHRYGAVAILLFAFLPNPFFDVIGIVAGAASYPLVRFTLLLFLGRLMRNILLAYGGSFF